MWRRRSSAVCICSISSLPRRYFKKGWAVHSLGRTRSSQQRNHLLLTADTFVRTALPGLKGGSVIVHAGPALGARFTQYTAEFEAGGELSSTPGQRFIFVMEGGVKLEGEGKQGELGISGIGYLAAGLPHRV